MEHLVDDNDGGGNARIKKGHSDTKILPTKNRA